MKALVLKNITPIERYPLQLLDLPIPQPDKKELLIQVHVCGVCRTDLHVVEGDLKYPHLPLIPGHQVVGRVIKQGRECKRFQIGDRVGIAWLRHTCGICQFCLHGKENLCKSSLYTGYQANGGYAEYAVVPEDYAYTIPETFRDEEAAPLLCAGIVGYRAFKRCRLPPQGTLAIYGFGSSAHIILQIAQHQGSDVFVSTREPKHQTLAKSMGASFIGGSDAVFPKPVDSVIIFAPSGTLVPNALKATSPGGTVVVAGIHMSDIPSMPYEECLFHEKELRSVEANTRQDGEEFLRLAEEISLRPHVTLFPLEKGNEALQAVKMDQINGTAVLQIFKP